VKTCECSRGRQGETANATAGLQRSLAARKPSASAVETIGKVVGRHLSSGEATRRRQLRVCLPPANSRDRKRERTDAMQDNETAGGPASLAARTTLESKRTVQR
jgi:hypothetical protein